MTCSICGGSTVSALRRAKLPAVQNRVYESPRIAKSAAAGTLDVHVCSVCGYAFNIAFDPAAAIYDKNYNNDVPSPLFWEYYREIAGYLHNKYLPSGGTVLDIGCGKGQFIDVMTRDFPDVKAVGIDPSCESQQRERLTLISDRFPPAHPFPAPDLIVCRHTLEHIQDPVSFIRRISERVIPETPVFFEVPDASWIVKNLAFWDWCYEHVNYFVPSSAVMAMRVGGIEQVSHRTAFGGQYLWLEGIVAGEASADQAAQSAFPQELLEYSKREATDIEAMQRQLLRKKDSGWRIAVWGMATKGIEFLELVDAPGTLVDYCIDINAQKQGKYTPLTARQIQSPEALSGCNEPLVVVVMNPNYASEIRAECERMRLDVSFLLA